MHGQTTENSDRLQSLALSQESSDGSGRRPRRWTDLMTETSTPIFQVGDRFAAKAAPSSEFACGAGRVFESVETRLTGTPFLLFTRTTLVVDRLHSWPDEKRSSWAAGDTPGGEFCNVFQFRGDSSAACTSTWNPTMGSEDTPQGVLGGARGSPGKAYGLPILRGGLLYGADFIIAGGVLAYNAVCCRRQPMES